MITPLVNRRGHRTGFAAGESIFDTRGRRLGRLTKGRVVDEAGKDVAEVSGNVLQTFSPAVRAWKAVVLAWKRLSGGIGDAFHKDELGALTQE